MSPSRDVFAEYLSKNRLKMTPQREAILAAFRKAKGHLSAEELYQIIREQDPTIGQATVYRTLKHLVDSGLAGMVHFGDGLTRYEYRFGQEHHDHLICERCGLSIELVDEVIEKRQEQLAEDNGFQLTSHSMYLYGLCPKCRKKKTGKR